MAKIQVLPRPRGRLARRDDGRMGDNVNKAISAYKEITGRALRTYDDQSIDAELEASGGPAFIEYTLTNEDVAASKSPPFRTTTARRPSSTA